MLKQQSLGQAFDVHESLGKGTFGDVNRATPRPPNNFNYPSVVAIKRLRNTSDPQKFKYLREVIFYKHVPPHHNLVQLYDMFQDTQSFNVVFVLECMHGTLYQFTKEWRQRTNRGLPADSVAQILKHICSGLEHIHLHGFVHRDLKPENILYSKTLSGRLVMKLADFGLSRPQDDPRSLDTSDNRPWTSYVATRWYRAPEQIVMLSRHTPALDMWAVGCILYELSNLEPLFPGNTTEDMVQRFIAKIGMPHLNSFGGGSYEAFNKLRSLYPSSCREGYGELEHTQWRFVGHNVFQSLLRSLLQWDMKERLDATSCIEKLGEIVVRAKKERSRVTS